MDFEEYNQMKDRLYLGEYNAAINQRILQKLDIKSILTVMDFEIRDESKISGIEYHFVFAYDLETQDLLTRFPETNQIIRNAQKSGHNMFVHCMAGISRSATIVIAFIMNEYRMPYLTARQLVESRRPIIAPNPGFEAQLKFYEEMAFQLNPNNLKLRQYLVERHLFYGNIDCYYERRDYVESQGTTNFDTQYMCSNCGHKVFKDLHIIRNQLKSNQKNRCKQVFIEPQDWMKDVLKSGSIGDESTQQSIKCPKCQSIFGSFEVEFKNLVSFECDCHLHQTLGCLYFRIDDKKIKSKEIKSLRKFFKFLFS